ncbi:hypothetical protein [Maribellus mangrovi]|uniref:hypothetical protein n=1 Tax=Maribellus mangrovi TaxID=3133146 RepID=UPI0030EE50AD
MDKEIFYINQILVEAEKALTTGEISKEIFSKYDYKISKKVVQNYLWSYFRNLIKYNPSDYTYTMKDDRFMINDVVIISEMGMPRAINSSFEGSKIKVTFDKNVPIEDYIKAISLVNYKIKSQKQKVDLLKQVNRIIEQIND